MLLLILSYVFLQICDLYLSYQFHIKRIKELKTEQLGGCLSLFHAMPLTDITNQLLGFFFVCLGAFCFVLFWFSYLNPSQPKYAALKGNAAKVELWLLICPTLYRRKQIKSKNLVFQNLCSQPAVSRSNPLPKARKCVLDSFERWLRHVF